MQSKTMVCGAQVSRTLFYSVDCLMIMNQESSFTNFHRHTLIKKGSGLPNADRTAAVTPKPMIVSWHPGHPSSVNMGQNAGRDYTIWRKSKDGASDCRTIAVIQKPKLKRSKGLGCQKSSFWKETGTGRTRDRTGR